MIFCLGSILTEVKCPLLQRIYCNRGRKVYSASGIEGTKAEKLAEIAKRLPHHYMLWFPNN